MYSIFYDLETSDQNFIGQILNFAFIAVDLNWNVISTCTGDIKVSRLQLPRAGAILANRVNLAQHQKEAEYSESQAIVIIHNYIKNFINEVGEKVAFVGYNSERFDLPFLRTSFIRNGYNPYFFGKLVSKDLLIAARKLSVSSTKFPRMANLEKPDQLSLKLETLTKHFGILEGKQAHTALDDVAITLDLARVFQEDFKLDVRTYSAYEVEEDPPLGTICLRSTPEYDLTSGRHQSVKPYVFLNGDYKNSLWIDLERFDPRQPKKSVQYFKKRGGEFFVQHESIESKWSELAKQASEACKKITLKNFFDRSTCDIEQDIYRLDMDMISALSNAFHKKDLKLLAQLTTTKVRDAKILYLRHNLANYVWGSGDDGKIEDSLKKYALYRYGGKLQTSRFREEEASAELTRPTGLHPTLKELLQEIKEGRSNATKDDLVLLQALEDFYFNSDIYRLAGTELEKELPPTS